MNLILDFWTAVQCQPHPSHAGIPAVSPGSALLGFASPRAHAQEKRHAMWTLALHRFRAGFLGDITPGDLGVPLLAVLAWGGWVAGSWDATDTSSREFQGQFSASSVLTALGFGTPVPG